MKQRAALEAKAIDIGRLALEMTTRAGSGHPSTSLSLAHITAVLFWDRMRFDPKDPWNRHSDRLVLSEGHAVPIVYAAYAEAGGVFGLSKQEAQTLTRDIALTLRKKDSLIDGHPNPAIGFPFFDAATGSLGQGLSVAAGLAQAARLDGDPKTIYCVVGDGESREGQIREAADFIPERKLDNVRLIVNCNSLGQASWVADAQHADHVALKLTAFGWEAQVVDGHDVAALSAALSVETNGKPRAVVARTVKGWGTSVLQGLGQHGRPCTDKELVVCLGELGAKRDALPAGERDAKLTPAAPPAATPRPAHGTAKLPAPDFDTLLAGDGYQAKFKSSRALAPRRAFGLALRELGKQRKDVVALDADVSNSTFSELFGHAFPERFVECKIAEQNMVSVAGGMAAGGMSPFISTFGKFFSRALDQIEMCVISGHALRLVGTHSGVSLGADGPSQMAVADMNFFRVFPDDPKKAGRRAFTVLNPSDAISTWRLVEWMANTERPSYLRATRGDLPLLYGADEQFAVPGAKVLAEGKDLLIAATGHFVHNAKALLPKLAAAGISAGLVDCYTLPLAADVVLGAARKMGKRILTLEDNYRALGSAVAEAAAAAGDVRVSIGAVDRFAKSAQTADEVFEMVDLGPDAVMKAARELVGR